MCNATLSIEVLKLHLAALEAIRGTVLGHAVTIGHGQTRLQVDSQMDLLVQYAALLQAAYRQELEAHADWYRSAPPTGPAGRRHRGDDSAPRNMHR